MTHFERSSSDGNMWIASIADTKIFLLRMRTSASRWLVACHDVGLVFEPVGETGLSFEDACEAAMQLVGDVARREKCKIQRRAEKKLRDMQKIIDMTGGDK